MEEYTHYQEFGNGETLVLLPSNWLTSWSYKSLAQKLARKYRVIVPDLYRGLSKYKKNALTVGDYTKQLHAFLQNQRVSDYYLIGVSFSSLIASEYLYQYPSELKKAMLISTIIPIPRKRFTLLDGLIGYMNLFYHNTFSWKGIKVNFRWLFDGVFNCLLRHPKQFFLDALIATGEPKNKGSAIPVPTKILMASKDEFIRYGDSKNTKKIHNLEIETIEGYHAWFFLNEELLVEKIFDYLSEL